MSENCLSKNPLLRDGTSQQQRLLKALLPSYVAVDERSLKDLVLFVHRLSSEIKYHEFNAVTELLETGNWEDFFDITEEDWTDFSLEDYLKKWKETAETPAHLALFFGFLHLFEVAQDDLNTITKRHLDFYYRDVLQLKENPAVADQAVIIFELAKNVNSHLLKKGTKLKAGKDDTGIERIYELEKDIVVNKAKVEHLKAVYANINNSFSSLNPDPGIDHRIFISPTANSADGDGADIDSEEKSWNTFGEPDFPFLGTGVANEKDANRKQAEIGFAIASPILFLAEGKRVITVSFTFSSAISATLTNEHFVVKLSGEKEWIIPKSNVDDKTEVSGTTLTLTRTLAEDQDAVVAYNKDELEIPFDSKWPVIQITLNSKKEEDPFIYKSLKGFKPTRVEITADVTGVKDLILQNDQAILDPSKPFLPFGSRPFIGSNFYIGSREVFQKKLDKLWLRFKWNDLPSTFGNYYLEYENTNSRQNSAFQVDIKCLDEKKWKPEGISTTTALFTDNNGNAKANDDTLPGVDETSLIKVDASIGNIERDELLKAFDQYDHSNTKGFLRLTLKGKNFGHKEFPNVYAKQAIAMAGEIDSVFDSETEMADESGEFMEVQMPDGQLMPVGKLLSEYLQVSFDNAAKLPNPPYTPSIQDLSLEYISTVTYDLEKVENSAFNKRVEKYFYVDAFGVKEVDTTKFDNFMFPEFNDEGNLYIGIKDLVPPQTLSILFQVAEGSANPDKSTQTVKWHYLQNNNWIVFQKSELLADSTNGLLTSGIVRFSIPKEASNNNTLLPAGVHWIRASVQQDSDAICKLIDVKCQAVVAKFKDNGNDPDHLRLALPAETIDKLEKSNSSIKEITQPYSSFNGEVGEESSAFYTRISERLRHKQRGITIWDYERLILQKFPSVYKVKCVNHTRFEGTLANYSEVSPGHVTLIIVSNVQNKNAVDPLRPKTSLATLDNIYDFITQVNPLYASVHVKNPIYEEVKLKFNVKFLTEDLNYYKIKLEQELRNFLSPWASECASDIEFGGRIHKSVVLNFVEERSYVDYVTCFEMFHIVPLDPTNNPNQDVEEAIATTAISILGSADEHDVNPIPEGSDDCLCEDNEVVGGKSSYPINECPCNE